ncbi:MAG TPA: glycosyltransferase family 4 protein [Candidatus Sulfotelmatobacter sp.]|nr:glycosyltransferase family 4 protein [Candidatus Sulfotelmatobacter sp.]
MSSAASIRVIHVFPNSARLTCGPCNAVIAFIECQLQHGLDVRAISPADPHIPVDRRQAIEHLPITEFDPAGAAPESVALAAAGDAPAVFHFHGLSPWSDQLARTLRKKGIPYVFTSHGQLNFHGAVHGLKKTVYLNFVNRFVRNAGGLHFFTGCEARWCKLLLPFWRGKSLVLHNLIRLEEVPAAAARPRGPLGIAADAFVFAYLGRLDVECKGLDCLMAAFARLAADRNVFLVLIGPDFKMGRQTLEAQARRLGCGEKVRFTGPQTGRAKWEFLKLADAFVFPSRWEAFGIALVEAAAAGLPVIVSRQINIAPELKACAAALESPLSATALSQAMSRLLSDETLRRSLSAAARRWVMDTCSYEPAGPRFVEFYQSVWSGRNKHGT